MRELGLSRTQVGIIIAVFVGVAACVAGKGGGDSDSGALGGRDDSGDVEATTGSESGGENCDIGILATIPEADSVNFFYQSSLEVELSAADPSATLTLTDAGGAEVAGSLTVEDDTRLLFTPSTGLVPNSEYSMSVGFCDGAGGGSLRFATSELGTPVSCDLTGKAYRLDLQNAQFVQPGGGFGGLLFDALSGDMLMGVESVGDGGVQMLAAFSESIGGQQDYCAPSTELPEAVFDNPSFRVGPVNTGIEVAGSLLTISSLNISGAFAPDCSYFGGGRFEGELDIRQNAPLFGDLAGTEDPDELCSFLGALGVVCEACSSDAAPYCAPLLIDQIVATNTGDPLACVSREYCHPECAANDCADPWNGDCSP